MTLIVRDELMSCCLTAGREVERNVKEQLNNGPLTDERLEGLFEPVVRFVEERTEVRIRREIDEVEAQVKEKKEQDKQDDKRAGIRAWTDGYVTVNVNGKRKDRVRTNISKRIKRAVKDEQLIPEFKTAELEEESAELSFGALDDEIDLHGSVFDEKWDAYTPTLNIKVDKPADKLIDEYPGLSNLGRYLHSAKNSQCFSIPEIIAILEKNEHTLTTGTETLVETQNFLKMTEKLLKSDGITLEQLFEFMTALNTGSEAARVFVMSVIGFIHRCQKHTGEPEVEDEQVFCGAYDCVNEVDDEGQIYMCDEPHCEVRICPECYEQGDAKWKKCEEHRP